MVYTDFDYASISFETSKITYNHDGNLTFRENWKFIPKPELNVESIRNI